MSDNRTSPLVLDAMIVTGNTKAAVKAAGGGSSDLWTVPPEHIHYDPRDNVRPLNKDRVRQIADLIKANGYDRKKPLGCFVRKVGGEDRIFVYEGQHRYHGALLAISEGFEIDRLPLVIDEAKSVSRANLIYAGIINNDSEKLTPLQLAEQIVELQALGEGNKAICTRLNITDQTIRDCLMLANAPRGIHKLVREQAITSTLAIEQIRAHGGEKALERLQRGIEAAKASGKTKATKKHVEAAAAPAASAPKKINETHAKQLLQALQAVLHDPAFGKLSPGTIGGVHHALGPLSDLLDAQPVARKWPVTWFDAEGCCDALDVLEAPHDEKKSGKSSVAQIRTAQPAEGIWIVAVSYGFGARYASSPLRIYTGQRTYWTRTQAICAGASDLIGRLTAPHATNRKADQAIGERVIEWAKTLLFQADPDWTDAMSSAAARNKAPDLAPLLKQLEAKPVSKAAREPLNPAAAWPFPSGSKP